MTSTIAYHCWDEVEFEEAWQTLLSQQDMTKKKLVVDVHVSNKREMGNMLYEELKDTWHEKHTN